MTKQIAKNIDTEPELDASAICEYAIFDQRGLPVCLHDSEFPTNCTPESCPLTRFTP